MLKSLFITSIPAIIIAGITYNIIPNKTYWIIGSINLLLGFFSLYWGVIYLFFSQKKEAIVTKIKRTKGEIPATLVRAFHYSFVVDETKHYFMPTSLSFGGFKEYTQGDSVKIAIYNEKKHLAVPLQFVLYCFMGAFFFLTIAFKILTH